MSSLFPSQQQPGAGIFIRERMFRVAEYLPITVVSPQPWFPGQMLIRRWAPGYRLAGDRHETESGIEIYRPRFFAFPGFGRTLDGLSMALASSIVLRRLRKLKRCDIIDAHFAYPDGYCASLLGRWLQIPVSITLRGTEPRYLAQPPFRRRVLSALHSVQRIFTVSDSLRQLVMRAGIPEEPLRVVGNGVDTSRFRPLPKSEARERLGLPESAKILITVGGLVERKGFHRVIAELPRLLSEFPDLIYLIVGGPCPEGDWSDRLRRMALDLRVDDHVRFLGPVDPDELAGPISAADVFVLSSSNEGWANVILAAMACGTPIVASDVGGNAEVVCDTDLGLIYPFREAGKLREALEAALRRDWDAKLLVANAERNTWDKRVATLVEEFTALDTRKNGQREPDGAVAK